ncbi:MAG TPA: formimidoylglutamate deiminase [Pyrinomonadaceae bacterium]|jgi:formimidoylglutamate deiminase
MIETGKIVFLPDLVYTGERFERGLALVCDERGRITRIARAGEIEGCRVVHLKGRALLPGLVNAHSHAFQRVIRGRTEQRAGKSGDTFWTWREMMYSAAKRLSPEDIYDASRMAFLEMALVGITAVGEFHYVHRAPDGEPYDDPNLMAKEVVRAARDVGLRIALLRVAYARSGYRVEPNARQSRFIEAEAENYLQNVEKLKADLVRAEDAQAAWVGVAPHSVRAVPLGYLREVADYANQHELPVHMHVAEQPAEVAACIEEHGRTPVALLAHEGLLNRRFTGVHGIHITPEEIQLLARASACICACPTTERNLGDGIVPADALLEAGVRLSLGTDSHTQIDLLEDARELEYHLRLQRLERNVLAAQALDSSAPAPWALASRLFTCATLYGAQSIGAPVGTLEPDNPADFFTIDLKDPSIAGASTDDLLACLVFSLARTAVREVFIGGRVVVEEGRHRAQSEIVERFNALQSRLWG